MIDGVIVIKKETGFTSHDVVAKMRGIVKQKKIGHTGTLDPQATGVLPVCLGNATKLCDMLTDWDKEYIGTLRLGVQTDTQDIWGKEEQRRPVEVTEEEVKQAIYSFKGESMQIPPMYSALKVNGKKLYELARQGKEVERQPRKIVVSEIEVLEQNGEDYRIRIVCSKGTYIRTLFHDIGQKLGCGGCMAALERSRVGFFTSEQAVTLSQLEQAVKENQLQRLLVPTDHMFPNCQAVTLKEETVRLVQNGNPFLESQIEDGKTDTPTVRVYDATGRFYGIYKKTESGSYRPEKMFLSH